MEPKSTEGNLKAVPLTWPLAELLAPKLTGPETMECVANGYTPIQALSAGLLFGLSWAVLRDAAPLGAYGFTHEGLIWSLWGPLSRKESVVVLRLSKAWIPHLVELSGRPTLRNVVHADNTRAIQWLQSTGCINLDLANPRRNLDGSDSYAFETFPSKRLN